MIVSNENKLTNLQNFDSIKDYYDYFIFDCDGVIWKGSQIIEDGVNTVKILISLNKKIFFLSNTNKLSRLDLKDKFYNKCGLDIDVKNIYTSSYIISKYINDNYPNVKNVFLLGGDGIEKELEEKGIKVYGGYHNKNIKYIENFTADKVDQLEIDENIQACVCGYDEYFNYFKINYAMNVINKTSLFFGTNYDHKLNHGNKILAGSYSFIAAIEVCTERKAVIVTKPDPRSLQIIMNDHEIDFEKFKSKMIMIGDNLNTDILFANNNGIDSLLVLTGVTKEEDLELCPSGRAKPTFILNHL